MEVLKRSAVGQVEFSDKEMRISAMGPLTWVVNMDKKLKGCETALVVLASVEDNGNHYSAALHAVVEGIDVDPKALLDFAKHLEKFA